MDIGVKVTAEQLSDLWARSDLKGERFTHKGVSYRVGKMSYGDYFLELGKEGRETDGFNAETLWFRHIGKGVYTLDTIENEVNGGYK